MQQLTPEELAGAASAAGLENASLALKRLDVSNPAIVWDAERPLYPASMIKVPLAAAVLCESEGGLDLNARISVTAENMTANDAASPLVPGYAATIVELIELAITCSDNVATNMLFDAIGRERATGIAREELGLPRTGFYRKLSGGEPLIIDPGWDGVHRNAHPVADAVHLLEMIAREHIPRAGLLRRFLLQQRWNEKLSMGLLDHDAFAHKTGDTSEVTHDGGILYTVQGAAYVVVAYTGMPSNEHTNAGFGRFMRTLRARL